MKFQLFALVGCLVLLAGLAAGHRYFDGHHHGGYWRRHHHHGPQHHPERHHWHLHVPFVNFEVHEPKGLDVSMVQRNPNITFFGIEVYVNRDPRDNASTCDICHNTTTITYGKFIVQDEDAIIKKGDVLSFYVLLGNSTDIVRHPMQKLWVTNSIINKCECGVSSDNADVDLRWKNDKPIRRPGPGGPSQPIPTTTEQSTEDPFNFGDIEKDHQNDLYSEEMPLECDLDPATNLCRPSKAGVKLGKLVDQPKDLQREVQILEAIIQQQKQECDPERPSNSLFLKNVTPTSESDVEIFVKSAFSVNPELQELANKIVRVMPSNPTFGEGVIFQMRNYIDKRKVLYHAQLNHVDIVDLDSLRRRHRG